MASLKQLEANRENAKRSTGPKSQAGKARSRLNSRKHGLTAKMLVIVGENANDFDALRAELTEQHEEERAFTLPLSREALELVDRVLGSHNSAWLFPSDESASGHLEEVRANPGEFSAWTDEDGKAVTFTVHGLRSL